jgi:ATPase subunit of ABC transporter with duplicated ATPase domains
VHFAELDGYTAEARAGELLLGLDIPLEQHEGLMSAVAPGWKLRVLLAQALFADPDIMLLDEPTNNLDINGIRWLEEVLNARNSTMIIISHDRHFLNSVCTHMADLDYGELRVYPGNYDEYMTAASQARLRLYADNAKKKAQIAELQTFVSRFSANASKAKQATSRQRRSKRSSSRTSSRPAGSIPTSASTRTRSCTAWRSRSRALAKGYDGAPLFSGLDLTVEVGERVAIIGPNGIGKTTLLRSLVGDLTPDSGRVKWSENSRLGYYAQDHATDFAEDHAVRLDGPVETARRRRAGDPRHAGTAAVLPGRDQETREGHLRRRAGPHAVRQADAAEAEYPGDGRAHQPPGHGVHRVAQHRAGRLSRHADLRQPRPGARFLVGNPDHRADAPRCRRLPRQLRRLS